MATIPFNASYLAQKSCPGPIGFLPRGAWSPTLEYVERNVVLDAFSAWIAIIPSRKVKPSTDDGTHWQLFAQRGAYSENQDTEISGGTY